MISCSTLHARNMAPAKPSKVAAPRKSSASNSPAPKKKSQPNASILSYFKKADESLFVENGRPVPGFREEMDDIYGVDCEATEKRYNEVETSVKKRKLSPSDEDPVDETDSVKVSPEPSHGIAEEEIARPAIQSSSTPLKSLSENPRTKIPLRKTGKQAFNNPFLDDSSDEGEDESTPPSSEPNRSSTSSEDGRSPKSRLERSVFRKGFEDPTDLPAEQGPPIIDSCPKPSPTRVDDEIMEGDFGEFAEFDDEDMDMDELAGEEYRAMRYMEEQARLEEEAAGYSCDGALAASASSGEMTESCPICNGSLAGTTPEEATAHVNACLDGNPTPLPAAAKEAEQQIVGEVDGLEIGKRFARAAVPRPGQPKKPVQSR